MSQSPTGATTVEPGKITQAYIQLGLIVLFWGINWPLTKLALADIAPLTFTALRIAGAAVVMGIVAKAMGATLLPKSGERSGLAVTGSLQIGAMLAFAAIGLEIVDAGRAVVIAYTMQFWALPLGWLIVGERPTRNRIIGALLVLIGVIIFFDPSLVDWSDPLVLIGNALLFGTAISWSLGACLYRRRIWTTGFWTQTFWQLAASAVVIGILAVVLEFDRPIAWTLPVWGALTYNWLIASAICYWWWTQALTVMPASQAGQVICLVPVAALLISAYAFDEPITMLVLVSVTLIMAGILLSARSSAKRKATA